ncbi:MAG: hypothetical protein ABIW82_11650, partial [Dokdonella sp.]
VETRQMTRSFLPERAFLALSFRSGFSRNAVLTTSIAAEAAPTKNKIAPWTSITVLKHSQ